jgi:hypothetical protein
MKKDKIIPIFFFSLTLFLVSFVLGYYTMSRNLSPNPNRIAKTTEEDIDIGDYPDLEILKEYDRISPNTFIERRIHYTDCDHVITKVEPASDEFVNMTKTEFTDYINNNYPSQKLISYASNKIALGIVKNHLCENHYIVGEENGKIAIFKVGENGEKILDKVFIDYPISLLMEIDQEKIVEGIIVDSEEELSEILENFIS